MGNITPGKETVLDEVTCKYALTKLWCMGLEQFFWIGKHYRCAVGELARIFWGEV
jgi:hypothetical protein